jgi:hypothetical protein
MKGIGLNSKIITCSSTVNSEVERTKFEIVVNFILFYLGGGGGG